MEFIIYSNFFDHIIIKVFYLFLVINFILYFVINFTIKLKIKKFNLKNKLNNIFEFGSTSIGENLINNVNFYIIAILFIIFDLELIFFLP